MKFKRLTDNLPAYKAGNVYETVKDEAENFRDTFIFGLEFEECGFNIQNDMGSSYYFSRRTSGDRLLFDNKWKRVE